MKTNYISNEYKLKIVKKLLKFTQQNKVELIRATNNDEYKLLSECVVGLCWSLRKVIHVDRYGENSMIGIFNMDSMLELEHENKELYEDMEELYTETFGMKPERGKYFSFNVGTYASSRAEWYSKLEGSKFIAKWYNVRIKFIKLWIVKLKAKEIV
jgi:hypothetical protein